MNTIIARKQRKVKGTADRGLLRGDWQVARETVESAIAQSIAMQRLEINTHLTDAYGRKMERELSDAADVIEQLEVIQRYRNLIALLAAIARSAANGRDPSTGSTMAAMKACRAAQSRGWIIEWNWTGTKIESIRSA